MLRNLKFLLAFFFTLPFYIIKSQEIKIDDQQFLGSWYGTETDAVIKGRSKKWTVERLKDGSYEYSLETNDNGNKSFFFDRGKWWIDEEGMHYKSTVQDFFEDFSFKIIDKTSIEYTAKSKDRAIFSGRHHFVEMKKSFPGSSRENPIVLKLYPEIYEHSEKICQNKKCLNSSINNNTDGDLQYHILEFYNESGEKERYYFVVKDK